MSGTVLTALLPIFAVIVLGHLLRRGTFPGDGFWPPVERLVYFLLFPALLFLHTATAVINWSAVSRMAIGLIACTLVSSLLLVVLRPIFGTTPAGFTSVFQGGIRFNTYVGLAAVAGLFGGDGMTLAAVTLAVMVPLVNLLCVTILVRFADAGSGLRRMLLALIRNPLILACVAGISVNQTGIPLPEVAAEFLRILGQASLPLGLLAVGAGLDWQASRSNGRTVLLATLFKLLVTPLVMWAGCRLLGVEGLVLQVVVLFAALPGAPTSYVLARQLGGDSTLMASILTMQTAAAALTLPVVLLWLL